ncbi:MAG: M23 family metallopeptidase [Actinomycetota bacterium]
MSATKDRHPVRILALSVIAVLLLAACASATPTECPTATRVDLSNVDPDDHSLPFRYPLDIVEVHAREADFCEHSWPEASMHHAAEDFWRPPGTPVYAMADGEISFSGTMGGYGWLVIVDHPEMNIYSLYGHLSPSRWNADPGSVAKGDLIGYLGDEWENGGSRDEPLVAHLHLGVRVGQRTDYPGKSEWRWMAGWIRPCPTDLGWLQPSAVIAKQSIPSGGFEGPVGGFLEKWWTEMIVIGAVLIGAVWWFIIGIRKRWPLLLVTIALVLPGVAWYLGTRGMVVVWPLHVLAAISLLTWITLLVRRFYRPA